MCETRREFHLDDKWPNRPCGIARSSGRNPGDGMANAASGGSAVVRIGPASRYYPFSTIDS